MSITDTGPEPEEMDMIDIQNHLRGSQEHILDGQSKAPKKPSGGQTYDSNALDLSALRKSGWLNVSRETPVKDG